MRSFKTMNYKPNLRPLGPPPAPGTVPPVRYEPLSRANGRTDPYGNIVIDSYLTAEQSEITLNHELVHRFLSPKFGPFLRFRAQVRISGYIRSAMLKYLEESFAQSYALMRPLGFRQALIKGFKFPLYPNTTYISIAQQAQIRGQLLGVIIVDGQAMTVSLEHGLPPAEQQQSDPHPAPR